MSSQLSRLLAMSRSDCGSQWE